MSTCIYNRQTVLHKLTHLIVFIYKTRAQMSESGQQIFYARGWRGGKSALIGACTQFKKEHNSEKDRGTGPVRNHGADPGLDR
jgi:hypothetical protein